MTLSTTLARLLGVPLSDVPPLNPDGPTAREWLQHELAKSEYQAAKPTWFDRLAQQIADWFNSLGASVSGNAGWVLAALGIALAAALIIGAFVVFGLPRLRRRTTTAAVFDDSDSRSADDLRRAAAQAARDGRYDDAVRDLFRALSRALGDRTIVLLLPGTTAQEVAALASFALPGFAGRLHDAARLFDGVRYLGRAAGAEEYAELASLDADLARAKPTVGALAVVGASAEPFGDALATTPGTGGPADRGSDGVAR